MRCAKQAAGNLLIILIIHEWLWRHLQARGYVVAVIELYTLSTWRQKTDFFLTTVGCCGDSDYVNSQQTTTV